MLKKKVLNELEKYKNDYFGYKEIKEYLNKFGKVDIEFLTFGRWEIFINGDSIATIEEDDGCIVLIY